MPVCKAIGGVKPRVHKQKAGPVFQPAREIRRFQAGSECIGKRIAVGHGKTETGELQKPFLV